LAGNRFLAGNAALYLRPDLVLSLFLPPLLSAPVS